MPAARPPPRSAGSRDATRDAGEREQDPGDLQRARPLAGRDADVNGITADDGRDGRDDAHRSDRHAAVERADARGSR